MYFPDLSPYSYSLDHALPNVRNIGWLDRSMPHAKGDGPECLVDRLKNLFTISRVRAMRGIHECNLCREIQWPLLPMDENPSVAIDGKKQFLGNWEIWIPGANRQIFASPGLVVHYVDVHKYLPPKEFISAVMDDDRLRKWDVIAEFEKAIRGASM